MLLMGHQYPPDIRVDKEARVLIEAGHEVFLLASDKGTDRRAENIDGVEVRRYSKPARLRSKVAAAVSLATFRSPVWESAIDAFAEETGAEALHVHDLPAVADAVAVARRRGLPVVFDSHENYPAAVAQWTRPVLLRTAHSPARFTAYEKRAVKQVDRVLTVVDESRDRFLAMGKPAEEVFVFTNVDDVEARCVWDPAPGAFTIAYAGGFAAHRGLETLLRALALVVESVPNARLVLMGSGPSESSLRELAMALGVADRVEFTGWIELDEMRSRLAHSNVGVVPHVRSAHTDSTIPHKLFQYMAMGLPVVVTDCAPLARIVVETGAGTVAKSEDPTSLAEAILALADHETASAASDAGVTAVAERYNLETEGRSLVALYAGLSARRRG
jgi:glycosyltransferase involved in cell wall biosynthesis